MEEYLLCDETTSAGCDVEQEKFLRGNEGRKAPVWWEQPTFSFWFGFVDTLPSELGYCNNLMNLNAPVGKKQRTKKYAEEFHGYHYVYDKGQREIKYQMLLKQTLNLNLDLFFL